MVQSKLIQKPVTREELNSLVDDAANIIRTATDYKFILVLLFLKRVSDTWMEEFEAKKKEMMKYLSEKDAEAEAEKEVWHTFNLKRELLWDSITGDVVKLPENLSNALIKTAELNKDLKGVIDKFSFLGFTAQEHREKLRQLVELYNQYSFSNKHVISDVVGDAYEHILYKFAPKQAKEGEVYTPREVIQLLIEILDPKPKETVYDPACGSGGMLIEAYKHVRDKYGREESLMLYGQEYNPDIYGLCRLNLIAHGLNDVFVEYGDSLLYPRYVEEGKLKQFHIVVANPPWNQKGYKEDVLKKSDFKERFSDYPKKSSADWAWVQHMLASAKQEGRIGLVIDTNILSRGGIEKTIRSKMIGEDLIDCILLLPEKLFYNTGNPGVAIIFSKSKPDERKDKILFINASREAIPHLFVKRLNSLSLDSIKKVAKTYQEFSCLPGFSTIVKKADILDSNLNVTLYVSSQTSKEKIDVLSEYEKLSQIMKERETYVHRVETSFSKIKESVKESQKEILGHEKIDNHSNSNQRKWTIKRIGDVCQIVTGGTPSTKHPEYFGGTIKWLKSGDIKNTFIYDTEEKITEAGIKNSNAKIHPANSVAIALSGRGQTRGRTAIIKVPMACSQSVAIIIPSSELLPEYLHYNLASRYVEIRNLTGDLDRSGLNLEIVGNIKIPIPPKDEQEKLVSVLLDIDNRLDLEKKGIADLERYKQGLMGLLLSS